MIRYPVSVVDHKETIKDPLQDDVNELKEFRDEQDAVIPDNVISGIKEIENFLANTSDAQTLVQLLTALTDSLTSAISAKYAKPTAGIPSSDLAEAVQNLLTLAGTALQQSDLASVLDTMQMDEQSGDITLQYDNGVTEQTEE